MKRRSLLEAERRDAPQHRRPHYVPVRAELLGCVLERLSIPLYSLKDNVPIRTQLGVGKLERAPAVIDDGLDD